MIILKYGRTDRTYEKKRQKVRCPECGCVMILDEEDYTIIGGSDLCYNPFKNLKFDTLKMKIEYKCAYCESKNTKNVRKYGCLTSACIRIFDFLYSIFDW